MTHRDAPHENPPGSITSDGARGFRAWLEEQRGFVGGYTTRAGRTDGEDGVHHGVGLTG